MIVGSGEFDGNGYGSRNSQTTSMASAHRFGGQSAVVRNQSTHQNGTGHKGIALRQNSLSIIQGDSNVGSQIGSMSQDHLESMNAGNRDDAGADGIEPRLMDTPLGGEPYDLNDMVSRTTFVKGSMRSPTQKSNLNRSEKERPHRGLSSTGGAQSQKLLQARTFKERRATSIDAGKG